MRSQGLALLTDAYAPGEWLRIRLPDGRTLAGEVTRIDSDVHLAMQLQRLLLTNPTVICMDDWNAPGFVDSLASQLQSRIDQVRDRPVLWGVQVEPQLPGHQA